MLIHIDGEAEIIGATISFFQVSPSVRLLTRGSGLAAAPNRDHQGAGRHGTRTTSTEASRTSSDSRGNPS
jgi:hypothetical protein